MSTITIPLLLIRAEVSAPRKKTVQVKKECHDLSNIPIQGVNDANMQHYPRPIHPHVTEELTSLGHNG